MLTFRSSYWITTGVISAYGIVGGSAFFLVTEKGKLDWLALLISLLITAIAVAVLITVIAAVLPYFKVKIGSDGILGYDFWGRKRFVRWPTIQSVKYINFGGLRYVRIFTEDNLTPLWLPLFLHKQEMFETTVRRLSPEGNSLRAYFEGRRLEG